MPGVAWNAGMFLWQRGAIRAALEKYTPLPMLIDHGRRVRARARQRLRPADADLDRPGGHGGRRRRPPRRDGRDGRRLERPRRLDGAARRRWASPGRGRGRPAGRAIEPRRPTTSSSSGPGTSCLVAGAGRRTLRSPPATPIALPRGARPLAADVSMRCSTAAPHGRPDCVTIIAAGARPRRRSSSARTAGGPGSPTTSRSRTSAAAPTASPATSSGAASRPRASWSPSTGGSPRSTSPRPRPRSSSPTTSRSRIATDGRADPDELVRGRPARSRRGDRDHGSPQPVDRQRLQGQGADRRRGRCRRSCRPRGDDRAPTAARRSSAGRSPTPRRPGSSSASTPTRATSASSVGRSTSTRSGRPTSRVLVEPL